MRPQRRTVLRAAMAAGVLGSASCARIPTTSPIGVEPLTADSQPGAPYVRALPPAPGAGPQQVVAGFVQAGVGGEDDYAVARQYLAPSSRSNWDPAAGVVIYSGSAELQVEMVSAREASLTVRAVATLDARGLRTMLPEPAARAFTMRLTRVQGQWRISGPPPGIFLSEAAFSTLFTPVRLYFLDARRRRLVPDQRWVPLRRAAAAVLQHLSEGPSDVFIGAVRSFVPRASGLVDATVTTGPDGSIQVLVPSPVGTLKDPERSLALTQLEASLRSVSSLPDVKLVWGGEMLNPGDKVSLPRPAPGHRAIGAGEVGVVGLTAGDGEVRQLVPSLADRQVRAPAIASDGAMAAALAPDGTALLLASTDGSVQLREGATGRDLVAPSIDSSRYAWTATRAGAGVLLALSGDGAAHDAAVDAAWLAGREVLGLQISPDDTRLLVLSADAGGTRLDLCAVRRTSDGVPESISEPRPIRTPLHSILQASWYDETAVIVLGADEDQQQRRALIVDFARPADALPRLRGGTDRIAGTIVADVIWAGTEQGELLRSEGEGWSSVSSVAHDPAFY